MKTAFSILIIATTLTSLSFMAYRSFMGNGVKSGTSIPSIDEAQYGTVETATFSMGCFWGPDSRFGVIDGVIRTKVGYAGGEKTNPTYHSLGNHAETIQVDYDPERVSYGDLLKVFWGGHDPGRRPYSSQYRSIIFYHDEGQKDLAGETKEEVKGEVYTEIISYSKFYRAEDYHQKYRLRQESKLFKEYKNMFPTDRDIVDSTSATKVNGYIYGYGDEEQLMEELPKLGLSQEGQYRVLELFRRREKPDTCGF
jgi:methionine-S-sulfoxide reductase